MLRNLSTSLVLLTSLLAASTDMARAQCPGTEDAFEDNDDCSTPWPLANGTYLGMYVEKEATDPDYFHLTVPDGEILLVRALFTHVEGDIDMELFDLGCNNLLSSSTSGTDDEALIWRNDTGAPAQVVLKLYVWSGDTNDCNHYDLEIDSLPDACGENDGFEDNDGCATAVPGPTGTVTGLSVQKTDSDYYVYTLADGEMITARIELVNLVADLDLDLLDTTCGTYYDYSGTSNDYEEVSYTNTSGAPLDVVLQVYVYAFSSGACNHYDLTVDVVGGGGCNISHYCDPASGSNDNVATLDISSCDLNVSSVLTLSGGPPGQFAYALIGDGSTIVPDPPGAIGDLCVTGGTCLGRYAEDIGQIDGAGNYSVDVSNSLSGGPGHGIPTCGGQIQSGETWNFQVWHRNPMGAPAGFSEALSVTFQ